MIRIRLAFRKQVRRGISRATFYAIAQLRYRNKWYALEFIIDTGASVTVVTDRDALRIFGDLDKELEYARTKLIGLGGYADTYIARNVVLKLIDVDDPNNFVEINIPQLYVATHLKHFRGQEFRDAVFQLPNLLGTDILQHARVYLNYLSGEGWIEFENRYIGLRQGNTNPCITR